MTETVYVDIDEELTEHIPEENVPAGPVSTWDIRHTLGACQERIQQCNDRLDDISKVEGTKKE